MLRDLVIQRVRPSQPSETLEWSSDGQLAVIANNTAVVFEPRSAPEAITKYAKQLFQNPYKIDPEQLPTITDEMDIDGEIVSITRNAPDNVVTSVGWSESGISSTASNLLGILTNKHYLYLFDTAPTGAEDRFYMCHNMTTTLLEENGLQSPETTPTMQQTIEKCRVHCFCWSPAIPQNMALPHGETLLAVGKEDGSVSIYRVTKSGATLVTNVPHFGSRWVVRLYWSPWTRVPRSSTVTSNLLAVSDQNALTVCQVSFSSSKGNLEGWLSTRAANVSSESRFMVSTASWTVFNNRLTLAVASNTLQLFIFDQQEPEKYEKYTAPSGTYDTISSVVCLTDKAGFLNLFLYAFLGKILRLVHKPFEKARLFSNDGESVLSQELAAKVKKWRSANDDKEPFVNVHGAQVNRFFGNSLIFIYFIREVFSLQYKTESQISSKIAFVDLSRDFEPLSALETFDEKHNASASWYQQWVVRNSNKLAPVKATKQDKTTERVENPERAKLVKQTAEDLDGYLANYTIVDVSGTSPKAGFEQFLSRNFFHNPELTKFRVLNHLRFVELETEAGGSTIDMQIRQFLGKLVVHFVAKGGFRELLTSKSDIFVYEIFHNLIHGFPSTANAVETMFTNKFVEETFEISATNNNINDLHTIVSKSGHAWPRCKLTSLPLLDLNNNTCSSCGKKIILLESINEADRGWFTECLLEILDICVFCGGRLNSRK
ncbi:hypothetical protein BABINDRAFT_8535 [Babjeviella inositovora NRRL Y-12698]|uniref:Transcription factor IIIC putative zinc-finger domain-containing protein n=1 Tax=Babjeviella inositovora NRRL Y-12698 TaxID=984486 RepID=A0A1E3QQ90_9ASCO|nr:uncharacterized protein BABINDRAFT_8535 [Babjeviella inositovora NRRL Y-12698]ODQ79634.1 hypothetical protein BABINDRAFT_8535 [Babjeviella inositovora NRRL Y-12698]